MNYGDAIAWCIHYLGLVLLPLVILVHVVAFVVSARRRLR
jgi:hypothetical protein